MTDTKEASIPFNGTPDLYQIIGSYFFDTFNSAEYKVFEALNPQVVIKALPYILKDRLQLPKLPTTEETAKYLEILSQPEYTEAEQKDLDYYDADKKTLVDKYSESLQAKLPYLGLYYLHQFKPDTLPKAYSYALTYHDLMGLRYLLDEPKLDPYTNSHSSGEYLSSRDSDFPLYRVSDDWETFKYVLSKMQQSPLYEVEELESVMHCALKGKHYAVYCYLMDPGNDVSTSDINHIIEAKQYDLLEYVLRRYVALAIDSDNRENLEMITDYLINLFNTDPTVVGLVRNIVPAEYYTEMVD